MDYTEKEKIKVLLMLIDFEKALDSISWKYLYNVLKFLGFSPDFIHQVKLLNTNVHTSVIQAGVNSDHIKIECGCKQRDSIASYLYIFCGQVLYYLVYQNIDVKGLQISQEEIKLSQFADDTTLILDGSQRSLEAALNTWNFGSYSGLKMNTTKTEVIWTGDKKHISKKLPVSHKLERGTDRFNLLGVLFSVNLDEIPALNYSTAFEKAKKIIHNWKRRYLMPFGKTTIIKTFALSQFNYLFASIPSPNEEFIRKLNDLLFSYFWKAKQDKIKRQCVTQEYDNYGLRMVNIRNYINASKLMWLDRIIKTESTQIGQIVYNCTCIQVL